MAAGKTRARLRRNFTRATRLVRRVVDRFHHSTLPEPQRALAQTVRSEGLTYLSPGKLDKLGQAMLAVERNAIPGLVIETGCALGGSAILLASCKSDARVLRVYDVFGMIPPPSERDGQDVHDRYHVISSGQSKGLKGQRYYGYETDLYKRVQDNFTRLVQPPKAHVELIAGLIEETLAVDEPVALAHIDVDWYDPVTVSLERIVPRLAPGGMIVLDDYFDWSGCREATDDFLARTTIPLKRDPSAGSLALIRS